MTDRILKILKTITLLQCIVLAALLAAKYYTPQTADAATRRSMAHNSSDPQSYIIPVSEINLDRDDGVHVVAWQGAEDVDLATLTSLADIKSFQGTIPEGKYTRLSIFCGPAAGTMIKVKGSVTVNGTPYYTKASHTNYGVGPAELEEFPSTQLVEGYYALVQTFSPAVHLGGSSTANVYALIDISNSLVYYDGTGTNPLNPAWGPGMYLQRSGYAITVGMPGLKEIYDITDASPGTGRLTLLFDGSGNVVGSNARQLLINSSTGMNLFPTWAPTSCTFTNTGASTYDLLLYFSSLGQFNTSDSLTLSGFVKHSSCSGNYRKTFSGATITGTYTATLIQ